MNLTAARFVILSYAILIAFLSLSSGELQDWAISRTSTKCSMPWHTAALRF